VRLALDSLTQPFYLRQTRDETLFVLQTKESTMLRQIAMLAVTFLFHAACFTTPASAADSEKDVGPLRKLIPPVTVTGGSIAGEGKNRRAELVVKSDSDRRISGMVVQMLFLRKDGGVSQSVPHTQSGFIEQDGNTLNRGASHTIKVESLFMKDDMSAVDGMVTSITFDDKTTWPPMPTTPPERSNDEPVAVNMIGVQGTGDRACAVVACFDYGYKAVIEVIYKIDYLDASGKILETIQYGHSSSGSSLIESGSGLVLSGGKGPPNGATNARASVTSTKFADGSKWKRAR